MPYKNKEDERERRNRNRERIRAYDKEYYKKNRKKILVRKKRTYPNKKKMICIICGKPAPTKYCSKKCMGVGIKGENNYNWQGGKSLIKYPLEWSKKFKKQIRERDGNMCMICNRHRDKFGRALDVHHIDGDKLNTIEKNCITLCQRHHYIVEKGGRDNFIFWILKFQKMLSKLYGYKYEKGGKNGI